MGNLNKNRKDQDLDRDIKEFLDAVKNADINAVMRIMRRYGYDDLHFATMECSISKIRKLLDKGASPNARDEGGMTPLHYAAMEGSLNAAEALIKHSDVNARDKDGRTPLHLALEYGHCNVALLLIGFGADVNVVDKNGVRPIHYAAQAGCVEVVKRLLEMGADLTRDKLNNTVLHYAVKSVNKHIVELVIRDEDVNIRNKYGETPLKLLLIECAKWDIEKKRCYEVAKLLLEHGADPTIPDARGRTPLDAARLGCSELAELLFK